MDTFSISQLQQFSGIKAHTIRIWEQRYNALKPKRSEGNTRYYDNSQLRRLLNIVSLIDSQHKVSELCLMPDSQLFQLIKTRLIKSSLLDETSEYYVSQLISAGMSYNEVQFEKIFSIGIKRFGLKQAYIKIIQPMLVRVGIMWSNNSLPPEQEHFISNLIRQKLFSAIEELPVPKSAKNTWLLFLPENEFHEISLLFSYYLIRKAGKKVIYLGSNVPLETLDNAVNEIKPDNILFFLVSNDLPGNCQNYLETLKKCFKQLKIYISGNEKLVTQLKIGKNIQWLRTVEDLELKVYP